MISAELRQTLRSKKVVMPTVVAMAIAGCGSQTHTAERQPKTLSSPAVAIGSDVSYPQCQTELPNKRAFGIIGLNGTLANNFNPCYQKELSWATKSKGSAPTSLASVYVHVSNPGNKAADWPQSGKNLNGNCMDGDTTACAYQYGENLAKADIKFIVFKAASSPIWLDVETNYSWEQSTARNAAVMEGMTAAFQVKGESVGIYSNTASWQQIAGATVTSSNLAGLPDWVPGGGSVSEAEANCQLAGFRGKVILTQLAGTQFPIDKDVVCRAYMFTPHN